MKTIIFSSLLISICLSSNLLAGEIDLEDRIKTQTFYREIYPILFDKKAYSHKPSFVALIKDLSRKKRKKVLHIIKKLEKHIPEKALMPLVYWKYIAKDQENTKKTISFILLHKFLILRDHIDNPLTKNKAEAKNLLASLSGKSNLTSMNIFSKTMPFIDILAKRLSKISDNQNFIDSLLQVKLIHTNLADHIPGIRNYVLSYFGFIPGNQVDLLSTNVVAEHRIDWFNKNVIFHLKKGTSPLDWNAPHLVMPTANNQNGHVSFKDDNPIFVKMREMVDSAEESIFIDIFLFGGTMGATFARYLIDKSLEKRKKNSNFKVLLLHDYATNYNMLEEMMPIFRYIKGRIENEPEVGKMMTLLQANIQRHPPGIPFGITSLIPKTKKTFKELEKQNTYYESKIDHSKVIVVDANTKTPQAYFGSKNWSDHSGGYYYDNAIYVKGPAAALIQASYLNDVEAALTEDPKELMFFYFKEKGFDNSIYLAKKKKQEILDWMKIKSPVFAEQGVQFVRMAEADVDAKVKNVRNILIDMIANATSHIYMEQLFIYDRYINDALIKRKIQVPSLQIKILADHNGNFGLNGLPNSIFLKEMKDAGIELKARKTLGKKAHFPDGYEQEYHQENHRKITSVDGEVLLGGSSNLNADTLQGSFREFGAQIFDKKVITDFETAFVKDWNNDQEVSSLEIDNSQIKIKDKFLSVELSALIYGFASTLLQSKDSLEERH